MKPKREIIISDGTATNTYGIGWQILRGSFGKLLAVAILTGMVSLPQQVVTNIPSVMDPNSDAFLVAGLLTSLFSVVYSLAVITPVGMSAAWVYLRAVRQEEDYPVTDVFAVFNRNYGSAVLAGFLVGLFVSLGFLLLIIPGIIIGIRLSFVNYLVLDEGMEAMEAVRASWEMTKGHAGTIFIMGLLSIPIHIAGLLVFIVGVVVSGLLVSVAFALLYHTIATTEGVPGRDKRKNEQLTYS
jgi:uncharacterized membrane protein